jgi:hypothetical protein
MTVKLENKSLALNFVRFLSEKTYSSFKYQVLSFKLEKQKPNIDFCTVTT